MPSRRILLPLVAAVAMVAVGVPGRVDAAPAKPTATEVGITASEIRIAVVADVENSVEPGLHQSNVDAVRAFAADVNAHGGLAGRHVVVDFYDGHLSQADTQNALIQACQKDFAMVGTAASLVSDITPIVSCPDQGGRPTGLPDLSTFALDTQYACSPVSFQIAPSPLDCSTVSQSPQRYRVLTGPASYFLRQHPGLHGEYVLSGDVKSVRDAALPLVNGYTQAGIRPDGGDGTNFISSFSTRTALTPIVQSLVTHQSSFVYAGVPVGQVAELRSEASAQGVSSVKVWTCPFSCYDRILLQAGTDVDGELVTSTTVPFEEARSVPAVARYLRAVGGVAKATGFGVQSWIAGLLFQHVVNTVTRTGGPNVLTRAAFLSAARGVRGFTADGLLGATDIGARRPSDCFLVLAVRSGRFVRTYPKAPGTFDCRATNTRTISLDLSG